MRKITPKERKNGMKFCTFCKPLKVTAIWRNQYLNPDYEKVSLACEDHKHLLKDGNCKPIQYTPDSSDLTNLSEADYQTWFNL